MPEFLVTGGAGFIGSNIVHTLVEKGASVRVFDNLSTGKKNNLADIQDRIDWQEGDLRNPDDLKTAVDGVRCILALAAIPSVIRSVEDPATTNEVNITGMLNLLLAARDAKVERFVFSSSSSIYGDTEVLPKREDMKPDPLSPYALSKLTLEHYGKIFHQLYGLNTYSLRYFNVFGPRQDPNSDYAAVIPRFVDALKADRAPIIYGDGEQTRDFTYVEDVVSANLRCCEASEDAAGSEYNVAWGNRTSIMELALKIAEIMGKNIEPRLEPARPGDVKHSQADSTRAREILGWNPKVTFEEGLEKTVNWFLNQA